MQDEEATTFAYDAAAYERIGYGNEPWVQAGEPALLGGLRVVPVSFSPVQYDPSRGTLRIARRMVVEVTYAGEDLRNTPPARQRPITPSFDAIYRELVLGYAGPARGQQVRHGTYLIICPNNASVISRLQPLIDWRQRQGLPVRLATTAETGTIEHVHQGLHPGRLRLLDDPARVRGPGRRCRRHVLAADVV